MNSELDDEQIIFEMACFMDLFLNSCRLHGVCDENPVAPIIRCLGLTLYRTSGDDSVLYDHDLERCLFTFFLCESFTGIPI